MAAARSRSAGDRPSMRPIPSGRPAYEGEGARCTGSAAGASASRLTLMCRGTVQRTDPVVVRCSPPPSTGAPFGTAPFVRFVRTVGGETSTGCREDPAANSSARSAAAAPDRGNCRIMPRMRLTRTPSLAFQSTRCSPMPGCQRVPSTARMLPSASKRGAPAWCSATTSHWSLNTGAPEEPGAVSAE